MEVSPNALRKETLQTYNKVTDLIDQVELDDGLLPVQKAGLRASLLNSKSQCLNTLTLLSNQGKR